MTGNTPLTTRYQPTQNYPGFGAAVQPKQWIGTPGFMPTPLAQQPAQIGNIMRNIFGGGSFGATPSPNMYPQMEPQQMPQQNPGYGPTPNGRTTASFLQSQMPQQNPGYRPSAPWLNQPQPMPNIGAGMFQPKPNYSPQPMNQQPMPQQQGGFQPAGGGPRLWGHEAFLARRAAQQQPTYQKFNGPMVY
jgi:hypothetical protein